MNKKNAKLMVKLFKVHLMFILILNINVFINVYNYQLI